MLFTAILSLSMCIFVSIVFKAKVMEKYEYAGASITEALAAEIKGDRVLPYLQTHRPDYYYNEVLDMIDDFTDYFDVLYIYVAVPTDENVLYIWCNGFPGEETIGYTTEYGEGGREWMQARLRGEDTEILRTVDDPEFGMIATAATPIYDSRGNAVALALVDFSVEEINDAIASIVAKIIIIVVAMMLIFIVLYYRFIETRLVKPIGSLTAAATNLIDNLDDKNHVFSSDVHTGDELEELSNSFETMDRELREYIIENTKITAEKERLGAELDMAASIQASQLPSTFPAFPDRKDFDIYASMTPAKTVGGDFYDFFMVDEDHIALVMADVSGKGIPASLFMMISKLLLQSRVMMGESPSEALSNTNAQLMQNNAAHQFVTIWLAVVDLRTGDGIAANAGHEHPVIRRAGGKYELVEYKHSPPVATMRKMKFKDHEFHIDPGDSIFVYTDGVAEANNIDNELFGTERMLESLNKDPDASSEGILANVKEGIDEFVSGAEQFDDITMMCFKYFGPESKEDG